MFHSFASLKGNYNFPLGSFYFNDWSRDTFIYQPKLDALELKRDKGIDYVFLVKKQMEYLILNLSHYILLSPIT